MPLEPSLVINVSIGEVIFRNINLLHFYFYFNLILFASGNVGILVSINLLPLYLLCRSMSYLCRACP